MSSDLSFTLEFQTEMWNDKSLRSTNHLEYFSDAVIAIAATLLIAAAKRNVGPNTMDGRFLLIGAWLAASVCACEPISQEPSERPEQPVPSETRFRCEGKTRCSQMSSCEEATFYIQNCPGTKMDGDGDGVPCESQWCGH